MREAVRFIATRSTGNEATLVARVAGGLVSIARAIGRALPGDKGANRAAKPKSSALAACRCVTEDISGASLQDRWSLCR
jgi:hypothetical protein